MLLGAGLLGSPALGQDSLRLSGKPVLAIVNRESYGIVDQIVYTANGSDFALYSGVEADPSLSTGGRSCLTGGCIWLAGLRLPAGALIGAVELSACDGDAGQAVNFALFVQAKPSTLGGLPPAGTTGSSETPGCSTFTVNLDSPHTVDNDNNAYLLDVVAGPGTNVSFLSARVYYTLQVSPAPGTATFPDVPVGHPQHRFVEALVAAGITAGCAGGNYCPNDPITRGQMAVFLSVALGLHFAP